MVIVLEKVKVEVTHNIALFVVLRNVGKNVIQFVLKQIRVLVWFLWGL